MEDEAEDQAAAGADGGQQQGSEEQVEQGAADASAGAGSDGIDVPDLGKFTPDELKRMVLSTHELTRREQAFAERENEFKKREEGLSEVLEKYKPLFDLAQEKPEVADAIIAGDSARLQNALNPTNEFQKYLEQLRQDQSEHFGPMNSLFSELSRTQGESNKLRRALAENHTALQEMRNIELSRQLGETARRFAAMPGGDQKFRGEDVLKVIQSQNTPLTPNTVWDTARAMYLDTILAAEREAGKQEAAMKDDKKAGMSKAPGKAKPAATDSGTASPRNYEEKKAGILKKFFSKHPGTQS